MRLNTVDRVVEVITEVEGTMFPVDKTKPAATPMTNPITRSETPSTVLMAKSYPLDGYMRKVPRLYSERV